MKIYISIVLVLAQLALYGQLYNQGNIYVQSDATLYVQGDINNQKELNNQGNVILTGNFMNEDTVVSGSTSLLKFVADSDANFKPGKGEYQNVELNKTSADVTLLSDLKMHGVLDFSGTTTKLILTDHDAKLTTNASSTNYSSANYVVADAAGYLAKQYAADGTWFYPVGDADEYSPIETNMAGSTAGADACVKVNVRDAVHPNFLTYSTSHLSRYWHVEQQGFTDYTNDATGHYLAADVVNTEADIVGTSYDGTSWSFLNGTRSGTTVSGTIKMDVVDFTGQNKPDDIDFDNDGIPDALEGDDMVDTDGDGVPDYKDLDSDNDGILDIVEAGGTDADGNGIVDDLKDTDGDGLADVVDAQPTVQDEPADATAGLAATLLPIPDTDMDTKYNFRDVDSDNDGITDLVEGGSLATLDADGDGMIDDTTDADTDGIIDSVDAGQPGATAATVPNTDDDTIPDYLDLDSDNDGLTDLVESGNPESLGMDADMDGMISMSENPTNALGLPLVMPALAPENTDGTGNPDYRDTDSDDDGITDLYESGNPGAIAADMDHDGVLDMTEATVGQDGIPDVAQTGGDGEGVAAPVDTEGDGAPDYRDTDTDNDGIPDATEAGATPTQPVDTDSDSVPDFRDLDTDNDGLNDIEEADLADADGDGMVDTPGTTATMPLPETGGTPDYLTPASGAGDTNGDGFPDGDDNDQDGIIDAHDNDQANYGDSREAPDLGASIKLTLNSLVANGSRNFVVRLNELKGVATSSQIAINVTVPIGFELTFDSSESSTTVLPFDNYTVVNSDWTLFPVSSNQVNLQSNVGFVVGASQSKDLGFTITRTTAAHPSSGNIIVSIYSDPSMTYDSNAQNNSTARIVNTQ